MAAKKGGSPRAEGSSAGAGSSTGSEGATDRQGAFGGFITFLAEAGATARVAAQEISDAAESIGESRESRDAKVSGAATKGAGKASSRSERLGAGVDRRGFQESIWKIASGMAGAIGRK